MRVLMVAVLLAGLATTAMALSPLPPPALTVEGFGPVKIGMTRVQAESALGVKLNMQFLEESDPNACGTGARADGKNPDVFYMVEQGKIVRIDVSKLDEGPQSSPPVRTAKGIGLGSSEAAVKAAYGSLVKVEPHPYLEEAGHYLVVKSADGKSGIIFETDTKSVIGFRAGAYPAVAYIEGCA
jgi:hypothetical protein